MHELIVINLSAENPQGLGKLLFKQMPRPGDWIEVEDENKQAIFYDVIQVVHSSVGAGADVYVANPKPATEARVSLHKPFSEKHSL